MRAVSFPLLETMTAAVTTDKLVYWVMGVMFTIIMALMGLVNANLDRRLGVLEEFGAAPLRERVSRLESEREYILSEMRQLRTAQERMLELLRQHTEQTMQLRPRRDP